MINKITESQVRAKYVKSVSGNRLIGTVEQNKDTFDKLPELIVSFYNALIDALQSSADGDSGADSISITQIDGVSGTTVQAVLESLNSLIGDVYTKTATDEKLGLKANQSTVDGTIKNVTLNDENGKLTFEKVDGSTFVIDTLLEKIITNFEYDPSTQAIKFTASDGTVSSVSIAEFVTVNEFLSSNQIEFSVSDGVVTATVKNGSITESMLNSALVTKLEGYASSASQSATNAAASASNASDYASNAAESALSASGSAASADTAKTGAESARSTAEENSTLAKSYAVGQTGKRDGEDADNSKYYKEQAFLAKQAAELARDEAREIAGGDYVTGTTFNAHTGNSDIHVTAEEKAKWDESDVFIATIEVTTSAEIEAAFQAGKAVFVKVNDGYNLCPLVSRQNETSHYFAVCETVGSSSSITEYACNEDVWNADQFIIENNNLLPSVDTADAGKTLIVNDSGKWEAALSDGIFFATYGTTTSAEIESAYQAGKACYVIYNTFIVPLSNRFNSTEHIFSGVTPGAKNIDVGCFDDVWYVDYPRVIPIDESAESGAVLTSNGAGIMDWKKIYTSGTEDLEAGVTPLEGLYFMYEE